MADDSKNQGSGTKGSGDASKSNDQTKPKSEDPGEAIQKAKADVQATGAKAKTEAGSVAEQAKQAASDVKDEATQAARDVAGTARDEIQGALEEQKAAGAERARRVADAIDRAGKELEREIPVVGDAMHRAAHEIEAIADALRDREPAELLDVAQDFARRQPAMFAGALGLVGFAAVRFLMASPRSDQAAAGSTGRSTSGAERTGMTSMPQVASKSSGTASGDPGGVSPEAPGFGSGNAEPKGGT